MIDQEPDADTAEVPTRVIALQLDLHASWARVLQKAGMPGADGVAVRRFERRSDEELLALQADLAAGSYRPMPLRLAVLPKKSGGARCLLVPTVRDRIVQGSLAAWLGARWNPEFDDGSFAYRPGRGVQDALRALAALRDRGFHWMLDADIRSFFDSISHARLLSAVRDALPGAACLEAWIAQAVGGVVWDGRNLARIETGVPQGSPLSPVLANFFLDSFDKRLRAEGLALVRYADDFLVLAASPFDLARGRALVEAQLERLGLSLNAGKTRTAEFGDPLRFLGADVRRDSIWLPLPMGRAKSGPVYVAPTMPRALLRAYATHTWTVDRVFRPSDYTATVGEDESTGESLRAGEPAGQLDATGGPRRRAALDALRGARS